MRYLLFILLFFPMFAMAQLEVGMSDGIGSYKPLSGPSYGILQGNRGSTSGCQLFYKVRHVKLSLSYNKAAFAYQKQDPAFLDIYLAPNVPWSSVKIPKIYDGQLMQINNYMLHGNYTWQLGKSEIYSGISFGLSTVYNLPDVGNVKGISAGGHIGYMYDVFKHICLNAELSGIYSRYLYYENNLEGSYAYVSSIAYYTCTAGIIYKFHFK